ncbi:SpoIIE family protein phosphatase [Streptomyces viridochromogenes]|uniref:Putative Magnesium or manganese-dependent protein phosphatase n=1 Tax=Streptomyces viridochromogenes Tue57 TaxID=1160705 RepID=L8P3Z1_STRVR|nr:putative Magnesium or manganese-dependent protein phosphatase [Streptomyces viridochromogenes Tue57]
MDQPVRELSESDDDPLGLRLAALGVLDDQGTVVGWSRRAQDLIGFAGEDVIGRSAFEALVDSADLPAVRDAAARCRRAGAWFGVLTVLHRDGHRVQLGLRVSEFFRGPTREWCLAGASAADVLEWQRDRAVLDGLYRRCPVGLVVHSPDMRILRVNRAIERFSGVPAARLLGRPVGVLLVPDDARKAVDRVRRVLRTGRPLVYSEQYARLEGDPARERVASVSSFPMTDPAGRILGVAEIIEDITERHRAQQRLALLAEAGSRVGTTLDVAKTAWELADALIPHLADHASVDLLQPVIRGEEPAPALVEPVVRVAACNAGAWESCPRDPQGEPIEYAPDTPQAKCLNDGRPVLLQSLPSDGSSFDRGPRRHPERGAHSLIVVPLAARGLVLGVMSLWRSARPDPFEMDDLTLAQEVASRAALSIDNARRFAQQQQTAFTLQSSLLPSAVPQQPAVEAAARYLPAGSGPGLGGDWFDVIPLSGARVALVVGDVVGRGLHAAATMGRLRTAVHTLASLDLEPDEVLSRLDDLVNLLAAEQEAGDDRPAAQQAITATCLYAVYDPISRRCSAARAGHPPPVVTSPDGQAGLLDLPAGPPLGLGGLPFEAREFPLAEGSLLALYTNGLIGERTMDADESLARLCAALSRPATALQQTCQAVVDALVPARPADDIALVIARTRVLPQRDVSSWVLPREATAATRARALVTGKLTEWGLEHLAFTTELIASELVTNAYRYADDPVILRLIRERYLVCEVSDGSHTSPHLRRAAATDEGGRGLFLVAQVAERWGTRYSREGKTVWTEQRLPGASEYASS